MATVARQKSHEGYRALVDAFPLVPIKSKAQLRAAQKILDGLLCRELDPSEEDYFEVLTQLVAHYEDLHEQISPPTLDGLLNFLMDARQVTAIDVAKSTGIAESTISQIRSGKRACSKANCSLLADYFQISPLAFLEAIVPGTRHPNSSATRAKVKTKPRRGRSF
jgi:antitoxin component HigA of HigAB toxin-antitoxin module